MRNANGVGGRGGRRSAAALSLAAALALLFVSPPTGGASTAPAYPPPGTGSVPNSERFEPLVVEEDGDGIPYVAGELIVSFTPRASGAQRRAVVEDANARVVGRAASIDAQVLEVPEIEREGPAALERKLTEIEADPRVESAGPNYAHGTQFTPNDPRFPEQWGLSRIRAPHAWDSVVGRSTVINVLDSGIPTNPQPTQQPPPSTPPSCTPTATSHPDLGKIASQADFVWSDFCAEDHQGHGTHVAGIAAALTDNATGIAGASPRGRLLIGKVCELDDQGGASCPLSAQIAALDAAASLPQGNVPRPHVINLSLSGPGTTQAYHDAIRVAHDRGIAIVAAAGNENEGSPKYPAAFPETIAVAGTDIDDGKSNFSNFGEWIDVAAPGGSTAPGTPSGENILSTLPSYLPPNQTHGTMAGTSMATPFVAGVASLLAGQGANASQIRKRILYNARDLGAPGKDPAFGHGLLNAEAAVQNRACKGAQGGVESALGPAAAADQAASEASRQAKRTKRHARKARKRARKAKKRAVKQGTPKAKKRARAAARKARRAKRANKNARREAKSAEGALSAANERLEFALGIRDTVC